MRKRSRRTSAAYLGIETEREVVLEGPGEEIEETATRLLICASNVPDMEQLTQAVLPDRVVQLQYMFDEENIDITVMQS